MEPLPTVSLTVERKRMTGAARRHLESDLAVKAPGEVGRMVACESDDRRFGFLVCEFPTDGVPRRLILTIDRNTDRTQLFRVGPDFFEAGWSAKDSLLEMDRHAFDDSWSKQSPDTSFGDLWDQAQTRTAGILEDSTPVPLTGQRISEFFDARTEPIVLNTQPGF